MIEKALAIINSLLGWAPFGGEKRSKSEERWSGMGNLYGKFESCWRRASGKKRIWLYIGAYTLAFLAAFIIAYSPFLRAGKTLIWSGDGRCQHLPIIMYVGRQLRSFLLNLFNGTFSIPLFDISMGSGDDVIGFLNSLGGTDPLLMLSGLVPVRYGEYLYTFLIIFRAYLAGLSFSYLCSYFGKRAFHTLIGSITYCFCGYAIYSSVLHPYFVNPMVLLPLLIVGTDKILKKEKPLFFILAIFYTVLCGYYHLYMMTIMVFFYAAVRFFDLYSKNRYREFLLALGRGLGSYLLGLGLGALIFLPAIMEFLNSSRFAFHNYSGYSMRYRLAILAKLISPFSWQTFAAIILLALALLLFSRGRRTLKLLSVAAFAVLLTSTGGLIMNGFQYASDRWSFGLALIVSYAVVEMLPELLNPTHRQKRLCILLLTLFTLVSFATSLGRTLQYLPIGVTFLSITLLVLTLSSRGTGQEAGQGQQFGSDGYAFSSRELICLLVIIFNVGVNGSYLFAPNIGMDKNQYLSWGAENKGLLEDYMRELEPLTLKNPVGRGDGSSISLNRGMIWQVPDMHIFSSVGNKNIIEFWQKMEHYRGDSAILISSSDQRTIVNTLFSSHYQVETAKKVAYVPYGYSIIKSTKRGNNVYENEYALPWGYTYDKVISYETLDSLNGLMRQEAMLQAVALDKEDALKAGRESLNFDARRLSYTAQFTNCEWKDGRLNVKRPNATVTLNFTMPSKAEGYVRLQGLNANDSGVDKFVATVKCLNIQKFGQVISRLYRYYDGRENYLFNLGYSDEERQSATITFSRAGIFKLKDIELYALPMNNYPARVNALRAEPLTNIKWGGLQQA